MSIYKRTPQIRPRPSDGSHSNRLHFLHQIQGWLWVLMLLLPGLVSGQDFKLEAWSRAGVAAPPMVLLTWPENRKVESFQIYRRTAADLAYGKKPVNPAPIAVLRDCNAIKAIIPVRSQEWKEIALILQEPAEGGRSDGRGALRFTPAPSPLRIKGERSFDPCQLYSVRPGSRNGELLQMLARKYYRIAQVIGQAFVDHDVAMGSTYYYEIRGLREGREEVLATNVRVVAGVDTPLPAPHNVVATAGDSRVMVTWDSVASTSGYDVYRRTVPSPTWIKVNDKPVMVKLTADLNNDSLALPLFGIIDYRRWDEETGIPLPHDVDGAPVDGPANKNTYRYRVSARNALGTPGTPSAETNAATPTDQTRPGLPMDLKVEAVGQTLKISWSKVTRDELGRIEEDGILGYHLYRATAQTDTAGIRINTTMIPQPVWISSVSHIDSDPVIISQYGEKEFYYRLRVVDAHNHRSVFSAAASGHVPDIYAPDPPRNVAAEGFQSHIRVCWAPNSEPDLESYMIYRSYCDYGRWTPPYQERKTGVDCGPFVLIAEMTEKEAADSLAKHGKICYNDGSVPTASPLCYAYLIKAKDRSQNESGAWPYPDLAIEEVVCQRLLDETPPPLPVVSGMQAQDGAIYIEWLAAPIQDLGAFHVYRAEKESDPYHWVGGMTVVKPPAVSTPLALPFKPAKPCGCDSIPLVAHEGMHAGAFLDKQVEPKKIYWYKVTSVDQNGNDARPDHAVPYSTFTFSSSGPARPVITPPIGKYAGRCGLEIKWSPVFDMTQHKGFVVFRGRTETGAYRQISPFVKTSAFVDSTIHASNTYWYKVQAFDVNGQPSVLSLPQSGKYE